MGEKKGPIGNGMSNRGRLTDKNLQDAKVKTLFHQDSRKTKRRGIGKKRHGLRGGTHTSRRVKEGQKGKEGTSTKELIRISSETLLDLNKKKKGTEGEGEEGVEVPR